MGRASSDRDVALANNAHATQLDALIADITALRATVAALQVDSAAYRTAIAALQVDSAASAAKLDADGGVTDTDYAASLTASAPAAATASAPSALTVTGTAATLVR